MCGKKKSLPFLLSLFFFYFFFDCQRFGKERNIALGNVDHLASNPIFKLYVNRLHRNHTFSHVVFELLDWILPACLHLGVGMEYRGREGRGGEGGICSNVALEVQTQSCKGMACFSLWKLNAGNADQWPWNASKPKEHILSLHSGWVVFPFTILYAVSYPFRWKTWHVIWNASSTLIDKVNERLQLCETTNT